MKKCEIEAFFLPIEAIPPSALGGKRNVFMVSAMIWFPGIGSDDALERNQKIGVIKSHSRANIDLIFQDFEFNRSF
jgi:hypothetical protein